MVFVKHLFLFCFLSHQRKCEILEILYILPCLSLLLFTSSSNQISMASLMAQTVKNLLQCWRLGFSPWIGKISWRRTWQPIPVFLPGESHGLRSLAGYSSWGPKESDTTNTFTFSLLSYKLCCIHFVKLLFKAIHASNVSHALTV